MKKLTQVKKTIAMVYILYIISLLLALLSFTYYASLNHMDAIKKMLILAVLAVFFVLLYAAVECLVLCPCRNGRRLFRRFTDGQIYQELIDKSPEMMEELGEAFRRFDELVDRNKTIQLSTKQAEFLALQNQINPHFLYNTLDAIRGDALCAGLENIADITEALSTFFRYTITETGNLVSIMDEIGNVEDYFTIQKYRFGEKLRLMIDMGEDEEQIMRLACPKLMLQPVVENAIFHGLEKKAEGGCVRIEMMLTDDRVIISVRDDGVGMDEKTLCRINGDLTHVSVGYIRDSSGKKGGIALNNVCRRIRLLFGEEYGIHVFSLKGFGTNVRITLPVIEKGREGEIGKNSFYD